MAKGGTHRTRLMRGVAERSVQLAKNANSVKSTTLDTVSLRVLRHGTDVDDAAGRRLALVFKVTGVTKLTIQGNCYGNRHPARDG